MLSAVIANESALSCYQQAYGVLGRNAVEYLSFLVGIQGHIDDLCFFLSCPVHLSSLHSQLEVCSRLKNLLIKYLSFIKNQHLQGCTLLGVGSLSYLCR